MATAWRFATRIQDAEDFPALDAVQFVTLAATGFLTNERVLTGTANQIAVTDGGAGAAVTLSIPAQLALPTAGIGGGILIGGDVQLYRGAANQLRTPDNLVVDGKLNIGTTEFLHSLDVVGTAVRFSSPVTDTTIKNQYILNRHYNNAEEDILSVMAQGTVGNNILNIGGGSGGFNANTLIRFFTGTTTTTLTGTERMRIDNAGNVGIGTTGPAAKLHVDQASTTGAIPTLYLDQGDVSEQHIVCSMNGADQDFPAIIQLDVTGTPALWWDESENAFGIQSAGLIVDEDVGIGTITPFHSLTIETGATGNRNGLGIRAGDDTRYLNVMAGAGNIQYISWDDSDDLAFGVGSIYTKRIPDTTFMTIQSSGNVGIGITGPTATLHVDQPSATAAIPVLYLDQADLSEEMIEFNTTIGVGNPVEAVGAKVFTPTHFVRYSIAGVGYRYAQLGTIA